MRANIGAMAPRKLEGFDQPKLEALVETMILAARADGEFSVEERVHFAASIETLTDRHVEGRATQKLVAAIEKKIADEGREARLASVKERLVDPASRTTALELAVALMASDGLLRTSERELVMEVADALDIDRDAAADIVARNHP